MNLKAIFTEVLAAAEKAALTVEAFIETPAGQALLNDLLNLVATPQKMSAAIGATDIKGRTLSIVADAFCVAGERPLGRSLRAMRTYSAVDQLISDAGSTTSVMTACQAVSDEDLASHPAAAMFRARAINPANIIAIIQAIIAAIGGVKPAPTK